jgi:hypothetical protein
VHDSSRLLSEARASLVRQQAGGRRGRPIGKRSAEIRRKHMLRKTGRAAAAIAAIIVAAMAAGLILDGIGFTGLMLTFFAIIAAITLFSSFPRLKVPERTKLNHGNAQALVGNTQLWLEAQRPALPAPAAQIVDRLGLQLDALGIQLEGLDEKQPAIAEVRKLVGEHLPGVISTYTAIPRHLRAEPHAGHTPDDQLAGSLGRISAEIDSITRQLAEGQIDNLAIQTHFLDYKYGAGVMSHTDPLSSSGKAL